jgi:hypothetical protein
MFGDRKGRSGRRDILEAAVVALRRETEQQGQQEHRVQMEHKAQQGPPDLSALPVRERPALRERLDRKAMREILAAQQAPRVPRALLVHRAQQAQQVRRVQQGRRGR